MGTSKWQPWPKFKRVTFHLQNLVRMNQMPRLNLARLTAYLSIFTNQCILKISPKFLPCINLPWSFNGYSLALRDFRLNTDAIINGRNGKKKIQSNAVASNANSTTLAWKKFGETIARLQSHLR